jgi:hypothetical protein
MSKIWFVTGAARGLGAEIAKAALAAGDRVVATGRRPRGPGSQTFGPDSDNLLSAVAGRHPTPRPSPHRGRGCLDRFGRIDVLVNNAGYGHLGLFEETTGAGRPHAVRHQCLRPDATSPAPSCRPCAPSARAGSSTSRRSAASSAARAAALLRLQIRGRGLLGIARRGGRRVRHPGDHRRARLLPHRLPGAEPRSATARARSPTTPRPPPQMKAFYDARSRNQAGDPAKLGQDAGHPGRRRAAPADPLVAPARMRWRMIGGKIASLQAELDAWRALSASTDGDDLPAQAEASAGAWL